MREMFDAQALFLALDAQREERSLTWPGVARELWEMSSVHGHVKIPAYGQVVSPLVAR